MNNESFKNKNGESFQETIATLETEGWLFIKAREYQNSLVFMSQNGEKYLHIGDLEKIQRAIKIQTNLYQKRYPVSPVLKTGYLGRYSYFIESSLGDQTFGDVFTKNIESQKFVDDQIFCSFCDTVETYFEAQIENQLPPPERFDVRVEVMAENVIQENPDLDTMTIDAALDRLQDRLQKLPFTYSHGDFAARNIFPRGVIDFEFSSIAPIGLDVFTVCAMESFWMFRNETGNYQAKFWFEQHHHKYLLQILIKICDIYKLDNLPSYQNDFILFKAFWSTAHERQQAIDSGNNTKWEFRRSVLMYCIEQYLNDKIINPLDFPNGSSQLTVVPSSSETE